MGADKRDMGAMCDTDAPQSCDRIVHTATYSVVIDLECCVLYEGVYCAGL